MILSASFSIRSSLFFAAMWLSLWSCAGGPPATDAPLPRPANAGLIAVLPIHNLTGVPAPLDEIHQKLIGRMAAAGFQLVPEETLQAFITRRRLRYMGGIDRQTAVALRKETGAQAALITALEFYNDHAPPKAALASRLVATDRAVRIRWTEGVGVAGDDRPGLLNLGLIDDPAILLDQALERMLFSLVARLAASAPAGAPSEASALPPDTVYRDPTLIADVERRIAVLPFLNSSLRRNAGDIMGLHFLESLLPHPALEILEPGIVRNALLDARIVMGDGISLADAQILFNRLEVDWILSGQVLEYEDYQGPRGTTGVCFSATLFERENRKVAWNAQSCRDGDQQVWFFDFGKQRTAHGLAGAMAQGAVESIFQ